jgi:FAD/FMN-containing dehydrogenase
MTIEPPSDRHPGRSGSAGIRNTNGYALAALLDADTPVEIFRRLIVGSEGTLAFLAEAVIDTIPAPAASVVPARLIAAFLPRRGGNTKHGPFG